MNVLCDACKQKFELTGDKFSFVKNAIDKNMTFLMIECDNCLHTVPINPQDLHDTVMPQDLILRCPSVGCYGWVSEVDNFFGCGTCGTVWISENSLIDAIHNIIDKYPSRAKVYNFDTENALPRHVDSFISQSYNELVARELFD